MNNYEQEQLLEKAKLWFKDVIAPKHLINTKKLKSAKQFNINPFLTSYLAVYLTGELSSKSVAKALLYPRVLGSSITTSFGQNMQKFISDVLKNTFGSMTQGIDIEFIDCIDGRKKYCQVKLGPNTINADDVETIHGHFKAARGLGRTNNVSVRQDDMVIGILYGATGEESSHYKRLNTEYDYPLFIGIDFWHRLTGSIDFYERLIQAISEAALDTEGAKALEETVEKLSNTEVVRKIIRN